MPQAQHRISWAETTAGGTMSLSKLTHLEARHEEVFPVFAVQDGAPAHRSRREVLERVSGQSRASLPRLLRIRQEHRGALPARRAHRGGRGAGRYRLRLHGLRALRRIVQIHHGVGAPPDQHGAARAHRRRGLRARRPPRGDREPRRARASGSDGRCFVVELGRRPRREAGAGGDGSRPAVSPAAR